MVAPDLGRVGAHAHLAVELGVVRVNPIGVGVKETGQLGDQLFKCIFPEAQPDEQKKYILMMLL